MPSLSPGNLTRSAIITRMSDPSTGFNANYALAQANYPSAPAMTVDLSVTSKNSFMGRLTADQLQASSTYMYPLVILYTAAAVNRHIQKFQRFDGVVKGYADWYLNFASARAAHDFETWGDAVEGAMIETFNNPLAEVQSQWTQQVVYNGDLAWERHPLEDNASNWRQLIRFQATFNVVIT